MNGFDEFQKKDEQADDLQNSDNKLVVEKIQEINNEGATIDTQKA